MTQLFDDLAGPPPPAAPEAVDEDRPREIVSPISVGDRVFRGVLRASGMTVLVIIGLIAVFLIVKAAPTLRKAGFGFLSTSETLISTDGKTFGVASLLPDTLIIALIALLIAVPVAISTAVFISEYARGGFQKVLIALVDLMAAIPSIIYGLWGLYYLEPRVLGTTRWLSEHLGFIPILKVRAQHDPSAFYGSPLIAGAVVSLMVIPLVASICREVYSQTPPGEREAAHALGATRWGMVRTVVLPFGRAGTIGAIMLGLGRAMGETIVVYLLISPSNTFSWRILESGGNSIAAFIASKQSESTPGLLSALLAAGLMLFVVTLIVNALASIIVTRSRSGAQTG